MGNSPPWACCSVSIITEMNINANESEKFWTKSWRKTVLYLSYPHWSKSKMIVNESDNEPMDENCSTCGHR